MSEVRSLSPLCPSGAKYLHFATHLKKSPGIILGSRLSYSQSKEVVKATPVFLCRFDDQKGWAPSMFMREIATSRYNAREKGKHNARALLRDRTRKYITSGKKNEGHIVDLQ